MKKLLLYIAHILIKQHEYLYKTALFFFIIVSLVYLFPTGVQFKYSYQKNKPWLHESIIAPFDFSINKSKEEIENERKEIKLRVQEYYISEDQVRLALKLELDKISLTHGLVQKGELVISTGQIISDSKFQILESLKAEYERGNEHTNNKYYVLFGHIIIVVIMMMAISAFLILFRKDLFEHNPQLTFILLMILFTAIMVKIAMEIDTLSIYLVPVSILPLLVKVFYDSRLALFIHLSTVLILAFWMPNSLEFIFIQIVVGIVAIFSLVNVKKRSQLFITSGLVFITYCMVYFGITISLDGSYANIHPSIFGKFAINSLLLLSAYPLIYLAESVFGLVSDVSLMELSDTNHPLLRQLATKAPGTFQHSMQVANLAESAVYQIGGNPLLVRVGALYHDIGKAEMPLYFIENQITGVNPHDELSFEDSAQIIISHVIKGIEMAKKFKLPDPIIDFIRTHHGTSRVQYFYRSFIKNYPEEKIDEEKFHYPGPSPFTKEAAVLMIADSVEAASRSLQKYDYASISSLVNNIIDHQIEQEQFSNANITFKNIAVLRRLFIKELLSIYHVRVEYPK